jgi:hypothetical protein
MRAFCLSAGGSADHGPSACGELEWTVTHPETSAQRVAKRDSAVLSSDLQNAPAGPTPVGNGDPCADGDLFGRAPGAPREQPLHRKSCPQQGLRDAPEALGLYSHVDVRGIYGHKRGQQPPARETARGRRQNRQGADHLSHAAYDDDLAFAALQRRGNDGLIGVGPEEVQ